MFSASSNARLVPQSSLDESRRLEGSRHLRGKRTTAENDTADNDRRNNLDEEDGIPVQENYSIPPQQSKENTNISNQATGKTSYIQQSNIISGKNIGSSLNN